MSPGASRPPLEAVDASPTPASVKDCTQVTADQHAACCLVQSLVRADLAALVAQLDAEAVDT